MLTVNLTISGEVRTIGAEGRAAVTAAWSSDQLALFWPGLVNLTVPYRMLRSRALTVWAVVTAA